MTWQREYLARFASVTPHWVDELLANRLRNRSAADHDPYPTVHAPDTRAAIERHAARAGLRIFAVLRA